MIYDCFLFFNELDLLEIRLSEMAPAVDQFILIEAPLTFQGRPKPLYFQDNQQRFRNFLPKIRHLVVDDMPEGSLPDQWAREHHQRNCLKRALTDAAPDDLVLVSDADEILRPAAIREAARRHAFTFFDVDFFNYYLDWKTIDWPHGRWIKPYAAPWRIVREMPDLSHPRAVDPELYLRDIGSDRQRGVIEDAGWHFSWLGGPRKMVEKLEAFSHTEPDVTVWRDAGRLQREIDERRFFYNGAALVQVPVDDSFPSLVRNNPARYRRNGLLSPAAGSRPSTFIRYLGDFMRRRRN